MHRPASLPGLECLATGHSAPAAAKRLGLYVAALTVPLLFCIGCSGESSAKPMPDLGEPYDLPGITFPDGTVDDSRAGDGHIEDGVMDVQRPDAPPDSSSPDTSRLDIVPDTTPYSGQALALYPRDVILAAGEQVQLQVRGGVGPYTFGLSGLGKLKGLLYTAPSRGSTTVTVTVEDARHDVAAVPLKVFDPRGNGHLVLWLDAGSLKLADNAKLSKWSDRSGKGNDAKQTVVANQPVYRAQGVGPRPGIRFDGNDSMATTLVPATGNKPRTLVAVIADGNPKKGKASIISYGSSYRYRNAYGLAFRSDPRETNNSGNIGADYHCSTGSHCLGSNKLPTEEPMVLVLRYDGTTDRLYANGRLVGSLNVSLNTQTRYPLRIGAAYHNGEFFDGTIAEVLVFDNALAESDRQQLECALGAKYGVAMDGPLACGAQPLRIEPRAPAALQGGKSLTVRAYGGAPPYRFSVVTGGGTIHSDTGRYTAKVTPGSVTLAVTDVLGASVETVLDVVSFPVPTQWYDATQIVGVADQQPLFEWQDLSGSGAHLRALSSIGHPRYLAKGALGRPALGFAPGQWLTTHAVPATKAAPRTLFVVVTAAVQDPTAPQILLAYGGNHRCGEQFALLFQSALAVDFNCSTTTGAGAFTAPSVITVTYDGSVSQIYQDGRLVGHRTRALTTSSRYGLTLGRGIDNRGQLDGEIAEVLVYGKHLDASERAAIEGMLATKHGIPN